MSDRDINKKRSNHLITVPLCGKSFGDHRVIPFTKFNNAKSLSTSWRHHVIPINKSWYHATGSVGTRLLRFEFGACTIVAIIEILDQDLISRKQFPKDWIPAHNRFMMTSSNGNIFRVTGPLCGEFTGPGEFPTQRPVTRSCDVFFDLRLNKRLSTQPWCWWFKTLSRPLWRHHNGYAATQVLNY